MKIKEFLKEEVLKLLKSGAYIYQFPLSNDERKDAKTWKYIRFILDPKTKKTIIFNATFFIHDDILGYLGFDKGSEAGRPLFLGTMDDTFTFSTSDRLRFMLANKNSIEKNKLFLKKLAKTDWSFAYDNINGLEEYIENRLKKVVK